MKIQTYLEYISLTSKLAEYNRLYHSGETSPITDEEYDRIRKDLIDWETENPDQVMDISPTFKVGYIAPDKRKEELRHEYRMLSMENALDEVEAQSWINLWVAKFGPDVKVIGEFKYDGMAISNLFIDGNFTRALTRGDGEFGEDITRHASVFLPDKIEAQGTVEIRGEAIIKKGWLEFMNQGPEKFANSRNAVAGLLRRNDTGRFQQGITFVPYDIEGPDFVFNAYTDKLEVLKQLGFGMLSCFILTPEGIHDVFKQIHEIRTRGDIPFDIDGMVFKIDDTAKQMELGETNHSPRHAFAYKFPPVTGKCRLLDVIFQVGRTGEVAPVAKVTATPLMGVIVTSVFLHNEERMKERNIAIGNTYEVWRSGDVIPHMGKLLESVPDARSVVFPDNCPCCGTLLVKRGAAYYCPNESGCTAQVKAAIAHAVSRDALNLDGLAEQTIELMLKAGIIRCTADIFTLTTAQIASLDGFTIFSAEKLKWSAVHALEQTFDRFIIALGIMEVGKTTARKLAQRIFKHEVLFQLDTPEKILELKVPDIGPSTAASIANYFANPQKRNDAVTLYQQLIIAEMGEVQQIEGVSGKTFVFTGKFSDTRETLENKVLASGGHISTSISSKTDYVVAGERAGSKVRKARLLGIDVIDERTFLSFFENMQ